MADGVHVRVWAPSRTRVSVVPQGRDAVALDPEPDGYFAGLIPRGTAGLRYGFRLDDEERVYPDPASRFQPEGPHGPSEVIDPRTFPWTDHDWPGVSIAGQVIYELHIGTFTQEGTYAAAAEKLALLADVGVTVVELMPVAEFPGRFGWGYDGVDLFAPAHVYGRPDDLRALRGPRACARARGHPRRRLQPPRPDGQLPARVRPGLLHRSLHDRVGRRDQLRRRALGARARVLLRQCRRTGFASSTSTAFDSTRRRRFTTRHRATSCRRSASARARPPGGGRSSSSRRTNRSTPRSCVRPSAGGYGLDALWNDDLHHALVVAATGAQRGVLHGLSRHAAGVHLGGEVGLPVPGPAVPVAGAAPRHVRPRPAASRVRHVSREPRPGRQHRPAGTGCTR